jgi:hypothetical protein
MQPIYLIFYSLWKEGEYKKKESSLFLDRLIEEFQLSRNHLILYIVLHNLPMASVVTILTGFATLVLIR